MTAPRKATERRKVGRGKPEPPSKPRPKRNTKARRRASPSIAKERRAIEPLPTETSQQALTGIAQDAVLILRRGLSYRADLALEDPGSVSMGDCIALLRLTTELGAEARKGEEGLSQQADYSRLAPAERVQLAALLLKVDYA